MGLLLRFAKQWIAGETLADAIARTRSSNALGIGTVINLLGEHYEDPREIEGTTEEYLSVLRAIHDQKLDATISIKLTQLGLNLDKATCLANVERILAEVKTQGTFLWIDMENSPFTAATLEIYEDCLTEWPKVGLAIQSYLRRGEEDLGRIIAKGGKVRLVKGAYREPAKIVFRRKADIGANYLRMLDLLFQKCGYFAVATHDLRMVKRAKELARGPDGRFEFEMLMGVRDPMKRQLAAEGYRMVEYVPYGPNWLPYFRRRLREKPSNIVTMVKSMIRG